MNSIERWSLFLAAVVAIILAILPGALHANTAPPFTCGKCGWSGHWWGSKCPACLK